MKKNVGGIKVRTGVKAGGMFKQHNRKPAGLRVRAGIKAGGFTKQHNRTPRRG